MPPIELRREIPLPAVLVADELVSLFTALAADESPHADLSIAADFSDLHLPGSGSVEIPIAIGVRRMHGKPPFRIDFRLNARERERLFPTFDGSLDVDPQGPSECTAWLSGEYTPPLGPVGKALDATVLNNVAQRTLSAFLDRLVEIASERVKAEQERAEQAERFGHREPASPSRRDHP